MLLVHCKSKMQPVSVWLFKVGIVMGEHASAFCESENEKSSIAKMVFPKKVLIVVVNFIVELFVYLQMRK